MANGTSAIGDILQGMGPGLLSGIGKAISDSSQNATHFERNQPNVVGQNQGGPNKGGSKPSYKNGTDYVPKTGEAVLHKGEAVLNKEDADKHRERKGMAEKKTETVHLSNHRVVMHLAKGGLHRALKVPEGEDIPEDKLEAASHSSNEHLKRMADLAKTMKSWKH
jgi:hypothetical protein